MIRAAFYGLSACVSLAAPALTLGGCRSSAPLATDAGPSGAPPAALHALGGPSPAADAAPSNWVNCAGILHVVVSRGYGVANAERLSDLSPSVDAGARIADLAAADLRTFCDWEACVRTNGYSHVCGVNDAGWERCRVCSGEADCDGAPTSQDDCVAHATDPGVGSCHVAILEECMLQRAIRLPTDSRVTESCYVSEQACAGRLSGDLSAQAAAARHETDQVTVEECERQLALTAQIPGNDASVASWEQSFSAWDGGRPEDVDAGTD